ncbi:MULTISPECIES: Fic/DOC family N-terminal domain-containing protein [unclassified Leucobacter]|uniref:Fic/DOC family N-terminal domain-containing protein n=1 Tax=unclassified Leucobacter TaxID=2621730 RepID=UPI00203E1A3B|nr:MULTISPECIES: Fic/DOC family N-terminal domain-containing protein [unclassified Leucobacter]
MPQDSNAVSAAGRPLWPALTYESRPWERSGNEVASRRAKLQARGEYRASVPPFNAVAAVDLAPEVRALADDANGELARFDATIGIIAAPFTSILLRTESASSSEIENLTSSAKQVALAEIGASQSENARLVFANARAMSAALELADDLSVASMHCHA